MPLTPAPQLPLPPPEPHEPHEPHEPRVSARLRLDALTPSDTEDLLRVYGDPDTWAHLPSRRFRSAEQARVHVEKSRQSFGHQGLGMWAIRVGTAGATASLAAGAFIGTGGMQYVEAGGIWNLGYRLSPEAWGLGFATELAVAALAAAAEIAPQIPVTARALTDNRASVAVLEKVGLKLIWEGAVPFPDAPEPGATSLRRVYADRELPPPAMAWLIQNL